MALAGCGGGGDGGVAGLGQGGGSAGPPAASPKQFAAHFERLTGVSLKPVPGDLFGTRFEEVGEADRFARFGVYSLLWTRDDRKRKALLGRTSPDDRGIHWKRTGTSFTASKPFGERLVLRWVGRSAKKTTPQFDRLERVVEAAIDGGSSSLPEPERPCGDSKLDPLRGSTGACSVGGIPVTFVNADESLSAGAIKARVIGTGTKEEMRFPGLAPIVAKGRFQIVAYRLSNTSPHPIRFLHPSLRIAGRTLAENPDTAFLLPRSRSLPLPPGSTIDAQAAFDIDESLDPQDGALVLPAEREGRDDPSADLAQGWIRLEGAPARLPAGKGAGKAPSAKE